MKRTWSVSCVLATVACLAAPAAAVAQTAPSKIQIGTQFSALRLSDDLHSTSAGFGGRASYDFFPWLSAETEFNYFPRDEFQIDLSLGSQPGFRTAYSRRRVEAFFGAKAGIQGERFGLFAKARPGFERLSDRGVRCVGEVCAFALLVRPLYRTEFVMDVGGVFEFYPSARTIARFDLGTTFIRHRSAAPPCRDCTSENLASSVGVGWRF
jgi:hypothetical protein